MSIPTPDDLTDTEAAQLRRNVIDRMTEHGDHILGRDDECGLCLWCKTCDVRVGALDLFVDICDSGQAEHPRFSLDQAVRDRWFAERRAAKQAEREKTRRILAAVPDLPGRAKG